MIPTTHRDDADREPWLARALDALRPPPDDFVAEAMRAALRRRLAGVPSSLRLGRYVVVGRLGSGRRGAVYEAVDLRRARRVAIRLLRPAFAPLRALLELKHPNVAEVFDIGADPASGRAWIAMELVDGVSLRRWLGQGGHSVDEILDVFRDAARGLCAGHAAGLVHGDFSGADVFVGAGTVKVANFALGRGKGRHADACAFARALRVALAMGAPSSAPLSP